MRQGNLFEGGRLQMTDSIRLTVESLVAYGAGRHWAIAWSGGKDSTLLVTLVVYLIASGRVPAPKSLTICYADTRMELLPLWIAAAAIREELEERGHDVRVVLAPLDERFFVYMFGRGVPPPSNTFRWCTPQIKVEPMQRALEDVALAHGLGARALDPKKGRPVYRGHGAEKLLVLTGVRLGESAARDGRIALACGRDGAECGQGWYQETLPTALCDTLAPVLHWRTCHVWEWNKHWAPSAEFGDWSTEALADAYGGDEAEDSNTRTGCTGCNLTSDDHTLKKILRIPRWAYLAPLKGLRRLYAELKLPQNRLRKAGGETRQDGTLCANQQRMGPLTFEARRMGLARVEAIQAEVNEAAARDARPTIDLINAAERARILELIDAQTWPDGWDGTEPVADVMLDRVLAGGAVQPLLFDALRGSR